MKFSKVPPDAQSLIEDLKMLKSDTITVNMIRNFFDTANQTQLCLLDVRFFLFFCFM
jgi:hypothetical protein